MEEARKAEEIRVAAEREAARIAAEKEAERIAAEKAKKVEEERVSALQKAAR